MFEGRILPLHQYILEQAKLSGILFNYMFCSLSYLRVTSDSRLLFILVEMDFSVYLMHVKCYVFEGITLLV